MDIRAAEISAILKDQIKNFGKEAEVSEVGQVLSVGDGIARVYGLDNVQAGEMVEFPGGIRGMALNLESDNVGVLRRQRFTATQARCHGGTCRAERVVAAGDALPRLRSPAHFTSHLASRRSPRSAVLCFSGSPP